MPPRYPAIAPRGPNAPPAAPETPAHAEQNNNLESLDDGVEGYAAQLAALAADKTRFLTVGHPLKDALNMALQQPAGVLLQRYAGLLKAQRDAMAAPPDSDDPTERALSQDIDSRPAIVALAETQVAKAVLGDLSAASLIADRVEGKTGLRKADVDAETEQQRHRIRGVISELVGDMVERRRTRADRAEPIDVDVVEGDDNAK